MIQHTKNVLFITLGTISLILGVIGIFLPLLPTTPLAILAAFFYSKGSPRLHAWLLSTRTLGPLIREWENYGIVRPKAKALSVTMIVLLFSFTIFFVDVHWGIKSVVVCIGAAVIAFIVTRPSTIPVEAPESDA